MRPFFLAELIRTFKETAKKWIPGSPAANARKQAKAAQFRVEKYRADLEPKITAHKKAVVAYDDLEKSLTKLTAARDKAKAKAMKSNDAEVQNKYYELEDKVTELQTKTDDAFDEMSRLADYSNPAIVVELDTKSASANKRLTGFVVPSKGFLT